MRFIKLDSNGNQLKGKQEDTFGLKNIYGFEYEGEDYLVGITAFGTLRIYHFQAKLLEEKKAESILIPVTVKGEEHIPNYRDEFSAVFAEKTLYIFGGHNTNYEQISSRNSMRVTQDVSEDDEESELTYTEDEEKESASGAPEYYNELYAFNMEECQWKKLKTGKVKPKGRHSAALGYSYEKKKLFLHGGKDKEEVFNDFYFYNLDEGTWEVLEAFGEYPGRVYGHTLVKIRHHQNIKGLFDQQVHSMNIKKPKHEGFLIFGGLTTQDMYATKEKYSNDVWYFSVVDEKWIELKTISAPSARAYSTGIVLGDEHAVLFVFGKKKKGLIDSAYLLMLNTLKFKKIKFNMKGGSMHGTALPYVKLLANEEILYVFGGEAEDNTASGQFLKGLIHPEDSLELRDLIGVHTMRKPIIQLNEPQHEDDHIGEDDKLKVGLSIINRDRRSISSPVKYIPRQTTHRREPSYTYEDTETLQSPKKKKGGFLTLFRRKKGHQRL
mmetsp:Transcript_3654/g.5401  ORF Transcript_3654/g.5401 Transcript_3654/m.5401 type:complete len:495 (+) Transcript_3654:1-1485(+)